ncbi:MAG: hypothetical protein AMXMBFR84_28350 [Candidatus Hydrogenedentota bacterium]
MRRRNPGSWVFILGLTSMAVMGSAYGERADENIVVVAEAVNPDPARLPTIRVVREKLWGQYYPIVEASFPDAPGFTCSSWCYEAEVDFVDAKAIENGAMEMRHRDKHHPQMIVITTITPAPGATLFDARVEQDKESHPSAALPPSPPGLNLCWQLRHATEFASLPEKYPAFVKRCFIFTEKGQTFLLDTKRINIPVQPDDHEYNNPPWVQSYSSMHVPVPVTAPTAWAGNSPDRFTTPVIGVVSRDTKYLAAIANDTADYMAQAWHDCMHNNPKWSPEGAPAGERRWRVGVYVMENDPQVLLKRIAKDFPGLLPNS